MRKAVRIELAEGDREVLERWSRSRSATVRLRERSRMVLMAAGGMTNGHYTSCVQRVRTYERREFRSHAVIHLLQPSRRLVWVL